MKKLLNGLLQNYQQVRKTKEKEEIILTQVRKRLETAEEARNILQNLAETIQKESHQQVSSIVTRCLKAVFGEEGYEFSIVYEKKRGKTEARLVFLRDGEELHPVDSSGGGVLDVASFALRLACLVLSRPQRRKLLVLDEAMKHLSEEYVPMARELLKLLASEYGIQIILITHSSTLVCGKVVDLT